MTTASAPPADPGAAPWRPRRPARQELHAVRGARIAVTRWGPDVTPIVLLHGAMDCGASYQLLADALPDDWPLAAIDWRGYGDSDPRPGGYLFVHNLADLDALLERLSPGVPARLVGHSLGGAVAATYAGVRPERVAWLVNLEGFGLRAAAPESAPLRHAAWLAALREPARPHAARGYASLEDLAARIVRRNPHLSAERARFLAGVWSRPAPGGGCALRADPLHRLPAPIRPSPEELAACWRLIRCPVLLLYAEGSELVRRLGHGASVERWHALVPSTRVVAVAAAGHMLHVEQPEICARAIIDYLRELA
ncbi:MAG: alpha/beta hydrolase [Gammaproteobacteria bacterium]|nr:alpha/beta hydrolase [Gammaproteobacteria bacterium]